MLSDGRMVSPIRRIGRARLLAAGRVNAVGTAGTTLAHRDDVVVFHGDKGTPLASDLELHAQPDRLALYHGGELVLVYFLEETIAGERAR